MNLRLAHVLLCSALALAAPAVAAAQNGDRPAKKLWDEFPLEATATPAGATATPAGVAAQPTPSPLARARDSGGMPTVMLIALLIVAAVVGDLAARAAGRRKRAREWSPQPQVTPPPASRPPAPMIPAAQRTQRFARPPLSAETCRVELHNRSINAHFYAISSDDGSVIARSAYFAMSYTPGDRGPSPPQALDLLVEELTAAGWRQAGTGEKPWDLLFRRGVAEPQPSPRRTT